MTTSRLPNRETFIEWPDFCLVIRKLRSTCEGWKRPDLDVRYPLMCQILLQWPKHTSAKNLCHSIQSMENITMHQVLRGHSTTTWTEFYYFLTPPLPWQFFIPWARDIHIECSKQFKWNSYFYLSGQSLPFWAALKLL